MIHICQYHLRTVVAAAAATVTVALGTAGAVSATTEPPSDTATAGSEAPPAEGSAPGDAAAFCEAELAAEAAFSSGDPAQIGPAVEALNAATPEEMVPTVEAVLATAENTESPEFIAAYAELIDYLRANCGFNELGVALSEYAFGGIAEEVPAGPTILTAANTGEEVHEIVVVRVNDDVTLSAEEIAALPEEEAFSMVTFVGGIFPVFPGTENHTVLDLTPGRHIALCFLPQGSTPEVFEQMMAAEAAAEGSIPEGSMPAGSAPLGTDHAEMTADTAMTTEAAPAGTATMETPPAGGSAPAGSAPAGEGAPHFMLGMIQEFTVS